VRSLRLLLLAVALTAPGCGESPTGPDAPSLVILLPAAVQAQMVACPGCSDPSVVATAEFPVTVRSLDAHGGVVESLETAVVNRSRLLPLVRNVRPNSDFGYPDTSLPARGALVLAAGAVFPLPPPRDEIVVRVLVRLTDGREVSATAPVVVIP
jgi:hypothetical protein